MLKWGLLIIHQIREFCYSYDNRRYFKFLFVTRLSVGTLPLLRLFRAPSNQLLFLVIKLRKRNTDLNSSPDISADVLSAGRLC